MAGVCEFVVREGAQGGDGDGGVAEVGCYCLFVGYGVSGWC